MRIAKTIGMAINIPKRREGIRDFKNAFLISLFLYPSTLSVDIFLLLDSSIIEPNIIMNIIAISRATPSTNIISEDDNSFIEVNVKSSIRAH